MKVTEFKFKNFAKLTGNVFLTSTLSTAYGLTDMLMIGSFGAMSLAGVGQAMLILSVISAFLMGFTDVYVSCLARLEGKKDEDVPVLALFLPIVILALLFVPLGFTLAHFSSLFLKLASQPPDAIPIAVQYLKVRLPFAGLVMVSSALMETLRVTGFRRCVIVLTAFGLMINAILNFVFLHVPTVSLVFSPATGVGISTVITQIIVAACCISLLARFGKLRILKDSRARCKLARESLNALSTIFSQGVFLGMRHTCDWGLAIFCSFFIGTLGSSALAASQVAMNCVTILYRLPQACICATGISYAIAVGGGENKLTELLSTLLKFASWFLIPFCLCFIFVSEPLLSAYGLNAPELKIAHRIVLIYLAFLPFYYLENVFSEILVAHNRAKPVAALSLSWSLGFGLGAFLVLSFFKVSPECFTLVQGIVSLALAISYYRVLKSKVYGSAAPFF